MAGVILIAYPAFSGPSGDGMDGGLLALSASVSSAIGSVLVKHLIRKANILTVATWQLILGSLPLLAVSSFIEPVSRVQWTPAFIGVLLFLALVGTSLVTAVWYWLLQKNEVGHLTLFLFLTPLFGLGTAALVFDERLGLFESVGVILVLAGIGVVARKTGYQADRLADLSMSQKAHRRCNLQRNGSEAARRKLKKISGRQARFQKDVNHCIRKRIVRKALDTARGIALEKLAGIRERVTVRAKQRVE